VQTSKAGILECADVFAVNKADTDGADSTVRDLELMIALGREASRARPRGHGAHAATDPASPERGPTANDSWVPPIVKCVAIRGEGTSALMAALDEHRAWVEGTQAGRDRTQIRLAEEVRETLREALIDAAVADLGTTIDAAVHEVAARITDPYTATERLVDAFRAARKSR
jgi:LAO/AO transport system kinase